MGTGAVLGVLAVLRDEALHLDHFLGELERLEAQLGSQGQGWMSLHYAFYENDSVDGTPERLGRWLETRPGCLISECHGEARLLGKAQARTQRLAAARNQALEALLGVANLDGVLVLDADLYFRAQQVWQLAEQLKRYPEAAMVCASAMQNVPDVLGEGPWSYYDSWALRDAEGLSGITFAANPFRRPLDRWRWMAGLPVPVLAAFGGMALITASTIHRFNVRWNGDHGCEHWAFCAAAHRAGPVLACPTVRPLVIHAPPGPQWSVGYAMQVRAQLAA